MDANTITVISGRHFGQTNIMPADTPESWRGEVNCWFNYLPEKYHDQLLSSLVDAAAASRQHGEVEHQLTRRFAEVLQEVHGKVSYRTQLDKSCVDEYLSRAMKRSAEPPPVPPPIKLPPQYADGEAFTAFLARIAAPENKWLDGLLKAIATDADDAHFEKEVLAAEDRFRAAIEVESKDMFPADRDILVAFVMDGPHSPLAYWGSPQQEPNPEQPQSGEKTGPEESSHSESKASPEGGNAPSSRKPIDWRSLAGKSPPEREWIVDDWLTHGPTLFVGSGGIGKTQLAQQASTCLAVGKDFIGHVNRPCRVLLWACEDDENELWRRQDAICRHYEVPMADLDDKLIIMPRLGMDNTLYTTEFGKPMFTPGIAELEEQINDYAADVVLLDNIGQVYGANENDRHSVTKFVNGLIGACSGRPVAVVLLAHPARSAGSEFAGSGAWENAVRMRWLLSSRLPDSPDPDNDEAPDEAVRYLSKRKANYSGKDFRQFTFRDGVLALDADPADAGGMTGFARRKQAERVVLESVVRLSAMAVFVSDRNGARNFAPSVILQYKLAEGLTKRELGDAMRNLMLDGKLKRDVVGHYSNRNEQFGLVVVL